MRGPSDYERLKFVRQFRKDLETEARLRRGYTLDLILGTLLGLCMLLVFVTGAYIIDLWISGKEITLEAFLIPFDHVVGTILSFLFVTGVSTFLVRIVKKREDVNYRIRFLAVWVTLLVIAYVGAGRVLALKLLGRLFCSHPIIMFELDYTDII